jgi:hypothetical protein
MEKVKKQEIFEKVQDEHKMLLLQINEPGGVDVEQIKIFLHELALAGTVAERTEDRSLLNELLRYWSSIINDKTGTFPVVQLYPFEFQNQPLKRRNAWKTVTTVMFTLVIILASTTTFLLSHMTKSPIVSLTTPTAVAQQTATLVTARSTATASALGNYSAKQPGPGCDTNGGIWTPQGISEIICGTQVSVSSTNAMGYLYFQLPNNKAFSLKNKISILGQPANGQCIGLAEQGVNTGFLVQYCGSGAWSIFSISSKGAIIQTLDQNITSIRSTTNISLTFNGTVLSFSIDTEVHRITISPIQPSKVAITYSSIYGGIITTNSFVYTVLSN